MKRLLLAVVWVLAVMGCEEDAPPPAQQAVGEGTEEATEPAPAEERALARTRAAAKELGKTLKGRLTAAMEEGGPPQAIRVCAEEAQELTDHVAEQTDVRVGRSSLRLRNPDNAPPGWVEPWLEAQGERSAEGVEGFARVDTVDGERRARVLIPIAVEGPCVNCHGPRDQLPEQVRTLLSERYPKDEAVGYEVGDLRGALWAESSVE